MLSKSCGERDARIQGNGLIGFGVSSSLVVNFQEFNSRGQGTNLNGESFSVLKNENIKTVLLS
jgi:hypothetical protein